jgi:hypothetical protein
LVDHSGFSMIWFENSFPLFESFVEGVVDDDDVSGGYATMISSLIWIVVRLDLVHLNFRSNSDVVIVVMSIPSLSCLEFSWYLLTLVSMVRSKMMI